MKQATQDKKIARIAPVDPAVERRRSQRQTVEIDALMREMGAEGFDVRLIDLSTHGFQAEIVGTEEVDVGARIWLMVQGCERQSALVKWIAGARLGAEFAQPVDVDALLSGGVG
ncbi:PilZ domain-containing protein [Sphingomicrobium sp. XHP0239]|uniref:PilZ domain-containing protein n=1 Tax=Sphingomicrobium maritimum TaxID=3133972 RepID=UPI0031CCA861